MPNQWYSSHGLFYNVTICVAVNRNGGAGPSLNPVSVGPPMDVAEGRGLASATACDS
jgi:hypothetical protein